MSRIFLPLNVVHHISLLPFSLPVRVFPFSPYIISFRLFQKGSNFIPMYFRWTPIMEILLTMACSCTPRPPPCGTRGSRPLLKYAPFIIFVRFLATRPSVLG